MTSDRFIAGIESPYVVAVGLDTLDNYIYWTDQSTSRIMRIKAAADGSGEAEEFFQMPQITYGKCFVIWGVGVCVCVRACLVLQSWS